METIMFLQGMVVLIGTYLYYKDNTGTLDGDYGIVTIIFVVFSGILMVISAFITDGSILFDGGKLILFGSIINSISMWIAGKFKKNPPLGIIVVIIPMIIGWLMIISGIIMSMILTIGNIIRSIGGPPII